MKVGLVVPVCTCGSGPIRPHCDPILGKSADSAFLDVVREMAETHDPVPSSPSHPPPGPSTFPPSTLDPPHPPHFPHPSTLHPRHRTQNASLDVVRAYHFGPKFLVEIEIVMAEETPLRESHDVGILLQHKIERLPEASHTPPHTAATTPPTTPLASHIPAAGGALLRPRRLPVP